MRVLTERGKGLKEVLETKGFKVIEVYPGGAQDVWTIPRAKQNLSELREGLHRLGIRGLDKSCADHELDAATAALVGRLYLQGKAEICGDFDSGAIIMPGRNRPNS
jgi:hypothetical protein